MHFICRATFKELKVALQQNYTKIKVYKNVKEIKELLKEQQKQFKYGII